MYTEQQDGPIPKVIANPPLELKDRWILPYWQQVRLRSDARARSPSCAGPIRRSSGLSSLRQSASPGECPLGRERPSPGKERGRLRVAEGAKPL